MSIFEFNYLIYFGIILFIVVFIEVFNVDITSLVIENYRKIRKPEAISCPPFIFVFYKKYRVALIDQGLRVLAVVPR